MTIALPRRAVQGAAALAQLLSNVQIHDCAFLPACKSRSFCTYKTTSHLHIPQLLKVPQFQCFALKSLLTLLLSADARMQGRGSPLSQAFRPDDSGRSSVTEQPPCFQALTHSRNRQFVSSV